MTNYIDVDYRSVSDFLRSALRTWQHRDLAGFGYEVDLSKVAQAYVRQSQGRDPLDSVSRDLKRAFADAGWAFVQRGVLRPGVSFDGRRSQNDDQVVDHGTGGLGFSFTTYGLKWRNEPDQEDEIPAHPSLFGELIARNAVRFGNSFQVRANEAVRCYEAHAYYACCAMAGAATEAIILSVARTRLGEKDVNVYFSSSGRSRLIAKLTGQSTKIVQDRFVSILSLVEYWRDQSAHGHVDTIESFHGYDALSRMVRFAIFVEENFFKE